MDKVIAQFRHFNRFYTRLLGLFNRHLPGGTLTLAQARVLFEIGATPGCSASQLCEKLGMDRGQLSRIVTHLVQHGFVTRPEGPSGRRTLPLHLTNDGTSLLAGLEHAANEQASHFFHHLDAPKLDQLRTSLRDIERILSPAFTAPSEVVIRPTCSGELGRIATRHAELYANEDGFDERFEHYVILGLAQYLKRPSPRSEVWTAELDGVPAGFMGMVEAPDAPHDAQLRWLLMEPWARGHGIGRKLVLHGIDFCRVHNYQRIFLWTLQHLQPARTLYESSGFRITETKPGVMGGREVVEERWEFVL